MNVNDNYNGGERGKLHTGELYFPEDGEILSEQFTAISGRKMPSWL